MSSPRNQKEGKINVNYTMILIINMQEIPIEHVAGFSRKGQQQMVWLVLLKDLHCSVDHDLTCGCCYLTFEQPRHN